MAHQSSEDGFTNAVASAAAQILRRWQRYEAEANITSAVRDFLVSAALAKPGDMEEETHPSDASRNLVDLRTAGTLIEVKRRIAGGSNSSTPNTEYVAQLDNYLVESQDAGNGVRLGVLTDGKHWAVRSKAGAPVRSGFPWAFTLEAGADSAEQLRLWLRDSVLLAAENISVTRDSLQEHFGPGSPHYERDIEALTRLYDRFKDTETIRVKRNLWHDLLRAALGEVANELPQQDDLFVRHTYLTAVIGIVVQAVFGVEVDALAASDPDDLLAGQQFRSQTGLQGVVESDFFVWPTEVGGQAFVKALAQRISRFDWQGSFPNDIASILYQCVIPADERRSLGEYYTPEWLARAMVSELVQNPLEQRVLDPSCGSGTFIVEAARHYIAHAKAAGIAPDEVFGGLHSSVVGIDVHPVAVHLARAAWALAVMPAIRDAAVSDVNAPIYLGDALQLRYRSDDMFAEREVAIAVENNGDGTEALELKFPRELVDDAQAFDGFISDIGGYIERGDNPAFALDDHSIDAAQRPMLLATIAALRQLHAQGRNHIWTYYIRNMVRPVSLSHSKVDVVVGNPPWLNYRNTSSALREALAQQSRNDYDIWTGGRYAAQQDVAGLFFARSVDLYLREGGKIGMVMPHSALQAGQYSKWRTGRWNAAANGRSLSVDFGVKTAWDLEKLEPNTFFPIASSVIFAERKGAAETGKPLAGSVERWLGATGSDDVRRERVRIVDTSGEGASPYARYARLGATIIPRCLFFVNEIENRVLIQAPNAIMVIPRRGAQDKAPWKDIDLTRLNNQMIETSHVFDVHLGETIVPYATLAPLKAVLPLKQGDAELPADADGVFGINLGRLNRRMRRRWPTINNLWEDNKSPNNKLSLLGRIDYHGELTAQLKWQHGQSERRIRVVYASAGIPTAALLHDDNAIVESKLFWITCKTMREAHYLMAIINSATLYEAVKPLMTKGQFGARDLQKHLWKLPIPEFDADNPAHSAIADAGEAAALGAQAALRELQAERGGDVSVRIARRELRKWLDASAEGQAVEAVVEALLHG